MTEGHNMRRRGSYGEDAAASFLEKHGCTILARNYTAPHGEIDIIAEGRTCLLFVEVKARTAKSVPSPYGRPACAVTKKKQEHIILAAESYLREHQTEKPPRMDVAEVYLSAEDPPQILHIRYLPGAFYKT